MHQILFGTEPLGSFQNLNRDFYYATLQLFEMPHEMIQGCALDHTHVLIMINY